MTELISCPGLNLVARGRVWGVWQTRQTRSSSGCDVFGNRHRQGVERSRSLVLAHQGRPADYSRVRVGMRPRHADIPPRDIGRRLRAVDTTAPSARAPTGPPPRRCLWPCTRTHCAWTYAAHRRLTSRRSPPNSSILRPPNLTLPPNTTPSALRSRNSNISSGRFKMPGMEAHDRGPSCPRCGLPIDAPLPSDKPRRGRRRIWCSTACRRAAHAERAAAERTGTAVRVIEVPRHSPAVVRPVLIPHPPTTEDIEIHVLNTPDHCAWVLAQITARARRKELDKRVLRAARELAHVLLPNAARY
jgi:hypothetical protein